MAKTHKGIHPMAAAGVVGAVGIATAYVLTNKKTREKVMTTFSSIREGVVGRISEKNMSSMKMDMRSTNRTRNKKK